MALTVAVTKRTNPRGARVNYVTITFDDSYPTGGEAITANDCGLGVLDVLQISSGGPYNFQYDASTGKVLAYYADYDALADGALIEVAAEVDLAAITVVATAVGA